MPIPFNTSKVPVLFSSADIHMFCLRKVFHNTQNIGANQQIIFSINNLLVFKICTLTYQPIASRGGAQADT